MEQHLGWILGHPRPNQQGFQELEPLASNMVYYEPERVICLYNQASLGANFIDACMRASALRQLRQDKLRKRPSFPVDLLEPIAVTDASRKSLASVLEAPGSDAALAQAGPSIPADVKPAPVLAPDELVDMHVDAQHMPSSSAGEPPLLAPSSPAVPHASAVQAGGVTLLPAQQLQQRRPTAPPVPPAASDTAHGVNLHYASLTLLVCAYSPTQVRSAAIDRAMQQAESHVPCDALPSPSLFEFMQAAIPAQVVPATEAILVVGSAFDHLAVMSRWIAAGHVCSSGSPPPLVIFVPLCAVYQRGTPGLAQVLPIVLECARCFLPNSHILAVTEHIMPGLFPHLADLWQVV